MGLVSNPYWSMFEKMAPILEALDYFNTVVLIAIEISAHFILSLVFREYLAEILGFSFSYTL